MVRLALVGCGGIGSYHSASLGDLGPDTRVLATVDLDAGLAETAGHLLGAERRATDLHEVLPDVDAVLLSLPHHLHHPIGIECLRAGKHVLMEKPLANSEEECQDLIRTAEEVGRVLMIAYCMRYHPLVVRFSDKYLRNETLHFAHCIQTGDRPLTDGPTSLRSLQVIRRLYDAERLGVVADLRGL